MAKKQNIESLYDSYRKKKRESTDIEQRYQAYLDKGVQYNVTQEQTSRPYKNYLAESRMRNASKTRGVSTGIGTLLNTSAKNNAEMERISKIDIKETQDKLKRVDDTIKSLRSGGSAYDFNANPKQYEAYWRQVTDLESIRNALQEDVRLASEYKVSQDRLAKQQKENERIASLDLNDLYKMRDIYTRQQEANASQKAQYDPISNQKEIDDIIRRDKANQEQLDAVNRDIYYRERMDQEQKYADIFANSTEEQRQARGLTDKTYSRVNNTYGNENAYDLTNFMTEEQRQTYNAIVAQNGSAGLEAGQEYLDYLEPILKEKRAEKQTTDISNSANKHKLSGRFLNASTGAIKPLGYAYTVAQGMTDRATNSYTPVDVNSEWFAGSIASEAAAEGVTRDMSGIRKFLAEIGMSIGQNLTLLPFGQASLAFMGMSSAADTARDVLNRGGSTEDAIYGGAAAGFAEVLFEKVSLDNLIKIKDSGSLRDIISNVLQQAGVEASEEGFTEITNTISDILINKDNSNFEMNVALYMAQGMTEEEARAMATKDVAKEIGLAMASGFLSGGVMGGGGTVAGVASSMYDNRVQDLEKTGAVNRFYHGAEGVVDAAKEMGVLSDKKAERLGEAPTDRQLGKLVEKIGKASVKARKTAIEIRDQLRATDNEITRKDSAKLARVFEGFLSKGDISKSDKALLSKSKTVEEVVANLAKIDKDRLSNAADHVDIIITKDMTEKDIQDAIVEFVRSDVMNIESEQDVKLASADDGQAYITSSKENVDITGVASIQDGKVLLSTKSGDLVDAKDVTYGSPEQAAIYQSIVNMRGISAEAANTLINAYESTGMNAAVYANAIREAYTLGTIVAPTADLKLEEGFAKDLPRNIRDIAYNEGKKAADTIYKPTNKKGRKTGGKVIFDDGLTAEDIKRLNAKQKSGLEGIEMLSKIMGNEWHIVKSYIKNGQRVIRRKDGVEVPANGMYYQNGDIYIDLFAGRGGRGTVLFTAAHEVTHFIRQWSPDKFRVLAEFLNEQYGKRGVSVAHMVALQQKKDPNLSYIEAYEEFVADSMEKMLADGKVIEKLAELKQRDLTLWEKIKEFFTQLADKIRRIASAYMDTDPDTIEGSFVAHMGEAFEQLQNLFAEGIYEASQNYASLTPGESGTVYDESGMPVAHAEEDGTVQLSMRTYEESGRKAFREYLKKCVSSNRLTQEEMQDMLDGIEEIYDICQQFKDTYAPFSNWSNAAVVRDEKGKPVFSVVTPNGEYKMNLDFSLVCKKRRTLDAVFNEMAKRGIIDDFELGQKSVVKINEIIRKYGLETACALCFVDAKRFRQASMADSFVNLYNDLVNSLVPENQRNSIGYFNFAGDESYDNVENGIDSWKNADLDFSHINSIMAEYGKNTVEHKAAKYIKENAEARKLLQRGDFMSSKGFDAVKTQNKNILSLYNSKKGTGGPKAAFGDAQYMNEVIQKARWWTPAKAYAVGGVRIQSFSDYVPRMVFDYVQMVYDLAATKLPAHAYTKESMFAKQFGLTGIKINMSLIPAIAKDGVAPGLDANGNYVWAGESFNYDEAIEIQNAEGYTENCGTICVGVSDRHIRKLLDDPNIRMVIPYHKSGLNPIVAHMNKIAQFVDYTGVQNTRYADGGKVDKDFDFNKALHKMGENGDPKAVVAQYLAWCDDNGYKPKFDQFRDHPNYYKLIEDFTLFDKDGNYVPQRAVRAVFPTDDSAFGSMKSLIKAGLEEDAVVQGKRDARLSKIVDEIERTLPKTEAEIEETEIEQADRDLEADVDVKNSLRPVDPVEPTSDAWSRTKTTEEAMQAFPNMWNVAADESEKRNPTQIASTVGTYRKIFDILKNEGFNGTILDASSGLGYGTEVGRNEYGFDIEDIEPYPDKDYKPKYTDYSTLNKKYDVIISSAVLNVLPQDQRDALAVKMGQLLKDGGRLFVTTRGRDVENLAKTGNNIHLGHMEWIETVKGSYQKGFTNPELIAYLKDALGPNFEVVPASKETGGRFNNNTNVVVTKKSDADVKFSARDTEYLSAVEAGDMETAQRMVYEAAKKAGYNSPKLYHGTKMFGFTKVKTSGVEKGVAWSPFFATNKEDISASYVPYGKVRDISSSMDDDAIEEARETAIEERKEKIIDLVYDFRRLIDRYFSPWVFGQTDNSYLESLVEEANPIQGYGDGVYDVLSDVVYGSFYDYQDEFGEYEDADDWADNSPEGKEIFSKIVDIEDEKAALHQLEMGEELGGIYQLYANLDNMYVVDGKGAAWNELRPEGLPKIERYGVKDVAYRTRDVAEWARDNGFDGVIFKNIKDNGAYGRTPAGDVYVFFHPESQVKSADPVTYDDNGNVIPLSERFKKENDDIRYSLRDTTQPDTFYSYMGKVIDAIKPQKMGASSVIPYLKGKGVKNSLRDSSYLSAVKAGDMETAQRMVDEAAWEAGYRTTSRIENRPIKVLHGTTKKFTVFSNKAKTVHGQYFGKGFYFTDSEDAAKYFAEENIRYYNPQTGDFDLKKESYIKGVYLDMGRLTGMNAENFRSMSELKRVAYEFFDQAEDRDGLVIYNIKDGTDEKSTVYVVKNPNQIKSADPVTYDDAGNVIPLSERFKQDNDDVRYSLRDNDRDAVTSEWKINLLREKIDNLRDSIMFEPNQQVESKIRKLQNELNVLLEEERKATKRTPLSEVLNNLDRYRMSDLKSIAEQLSQSAWEYEDDISREELIDGIREIINDMAEDMSPIEMQAPRYGVWVREPVGNVKTQLREDGPSNREILVNALMETAQNDAEREQLEKYKAKIKDIDALDMHLAEVKGELKKLGRFPKGKEAIAERKKLIEDKVKTENRIGVLDKQLLRIEASKPLKDLLWREKRKSYREAYREQRALWKEEVRDIMQKNRESRAKNVDSRRKTQVRARILQNAKELRKLLVRGDKKRNIKQGQQDAVESAVNLAEVLFSNEGLSNEMLAKTMAPEIIARYPDVEKYVDFLEKRDGILESIRNAENDSAKEKLQKELDKVKRNIYALNKSLDEVFKGERRARSEGRVTDAIDKLATAYESTKNSEYSYIASAYDEDLTNYIRALSDNLKGTIVKDMTLNQLEEVYKVYKMVLHSVRRANKAFAENLKMTREQLATATMAEIKKAGGEHLYEGAARKGINSYLWNNLKPIYAFERIGSDTLMQLYKNIRKGEDVWMRNAHDAKVFQNKLAEKYGFDDWDFDKVYTFTSSTGEEFKLNLEQIMSIYAYSKRESAIPHLTDGGIQIGDDQTLKIDGKKVKASSAKAYPLSLETIGEINKVITEDKNKQMYVDLMQDYLSKVMGAKGNEVSMKLYGVELFGEENYFPIKVSSDRMEKAREQQEMAVKVKSYGFTNSLTPNARATIMLTGFTNTWDNHVQEMSMYHAMTLPMEDFYRVINYKEIGDGDNGVIPALKNAYGEAATKYINDFLKDVNGGVRIDDRMGFVNKLTSKYKKAAVVASLSVAAQQPSSIGRAFALISPKYFLAKDNRVLKTEDRTWDEIKKYAPVAAIKEMGYFDTNMGMGFGDYIHAKKYKGIKEMAKGVLTDSTYRDEVATIIPAIMDKVVWNAIWKAVKRETMATRKDLKLNSKEFLEHCGERFTEIIEKTQVYDSVFSRSSFMRSKNPLAKALTSFLAEPTTSINMLQEAIWKLRKGDKRGAAKVAASVYTAVLLNAVLASFIYAMRDKDEEENFFEKYMQSFATEIVDGVNPIGSLPFLKDIWSVAQGFDVERSDMSLIKDMGDSLQGIVKAIEKGEGLEQALWTTADTLGSFFGLPVKNIRRDINGFINFGDTLANGTVASPKVFWDGIGETLKKNLPIVGWFKDKEKSEKLYDAIVSGDTAYINRLKGTYKDEDAFNSAARSALKEYDPRIKLAAQARLDGDTATYLKYADAIRKEKHFSQDDIVRAINSMMSSLSDSESSSSGSTPLVTNEDYYNAIRHEDYATAEDVKDILVSAIVEKGESEKEAIDSVESSFVGQVKSHYIGGLVDEKSARKMMQEYGGLDAEEADSRLKEWGFEATYGYSWGQRDRAYRLGAIDRDSLIDALMDINGYDYDRAVNSVRYIEAKEEYPELDLTESELNIYYSKVSDSGLTLEEYQMYVERKSGVKGKENIMDVIDSLPISDSQKDALYYLNGWKSSRLYEAPWR